MKKLQIGVMRQFLASVCANIPTIMYSTMVGWASPTIPILRSPETPLPSGPLTTTEVSTISSIMYLAGMLGGLSSGWLADRIGRKWLLIIGTIPSIAAFVLLATAKNVIYLYISRILSGLSGGIVFIVLPIYVSEISQDNIRGTLGGFLNYFHTTGMLLGFIICSRISFYTIPYIMLGIALTFFCSFLWFPETPPYLLYRNRNDEAMKSLRFFRGVKQGNEEPINLRIEFDRLESNVKIAQERKNIGLADFAKPSTRLALIISAILLCGRNFCGTFAMANYISIIFAEAGSDLSPNDSAIVIGAVQVIGSFVSLGLVDKFGRRILLMISALCTGITHVALGIYFQLKASGYDLSSYGWFPLITMSAMYFVSSIGLMNIPFFLMAEILPIKIRSFVITINLSTQWPVTFLLVQYFILASEAFGTQTILWIFAGWCFFELFFVFFVVPETKGKNFTEIEDALSKKR